MPNQVPPRITEDDREATVRRLQEAFAEGPHFARGDGRSPGSGADRQDPR